MFWQDQSGKDWTVEHSPRGASPWLIHSYYETRDDAQEALMEILRCPWMDSDPSHYRIDGPQRCPGCNHMSDGMLDYHGVCSVCGWWVEWQSASAPCG